MCFPLFLDNTADKLLSKKIQFFTAIRRGETRTGCNVFCCCCNINARLISVYNTRVSRNESPESRVKIFNYPDARSSGVINSPRDDINKTGNKEMVRRDMLENVLFVHFVRQRDRTRTVFGEISRHMSTRTHEYNNNAVRRNR